MITLFSSDHIHTIEEMCVALRKQIESLPRMLSTVGQMNKILRFEYRIESTDLLVWLHNQKIKERLYWSKRTGQEEIAGVGVADVLQSSQSYQLIFEKIEDKLSANNPRLRYYGGFAFSKESIDDKWDAFGLSRFCVPQFELSRWQDDCFFAFHISMVDVSEEHIQKVLIDFDTLVFDFETHYRSVPQMIHRMDQPTEDQWNAMVDAVLTGDNAKVVLARESQFQFDLKLWPHALIKFLKGLTPHCHHFCFQLDDQTGFLGATPERLFQLEGSALKSEAIAGTAQDEETLRKSKYTLEHQFVVDHLKEQCAALCETWEADAEPSILSLKEAKHWQTQFRGNLKSHFTATDVLERLHPTPAVGGFHKKQAQSKFNC